MLSLFSFSHQHDANVGTLEVHGGSLNYPHFFWILFSFCCSDWVFSSSLPFKFLAWSSASSTLLPIPYNVFFISVSIFFISDWIFFMVSVSFFMLFKFTLSSSTLPLCSLSILITSVLNSASNRLLISLLFSSFSVVLFYSFIWGMFPCLLILAASLHLFLCIR